MSIATTSPRLFSRAWSGLLLLILAFLIIYPTAMLLLGALTDANPVIDGFANMQLSLSNFATVLANPTVHAALGNSLLACAGGTPLAVVIGLFLAWIVVHTHTPFGRSAPRETRSNQWLPRKKQFR